MGAQLLQAGPEPWRRGGGAQSIVVPLKSSTRSLKSGSMRSDGRSPSSLAASLSAPSEMRYLGGQGSSGEVAEGALTPTPGRGLPLTHTLVGFLQEGRREGNLTLRKRLFSPQGRRQKGGSRSSWGSQLDLGRPDHIPEAP